MKLAIMLLQLFVLIIAPPHSRNVSCQERHSFEIYPIEKIDAKSLLDRNEIIRGPQWERITMAALPILTSKDIVQYEWGTHTMTLTSFAVGRIRRPSSVYGDAFAIVADGQKIYVGLFTTVASNFSVYPVPNIHVDSPWGPLDKLTIIGGAREYLGNPIKDMRSDERIRNALAALGKLK